MIAELKEKLAAVDDAEITDLRRQNSVLSESLTEARSENTRSANMINSLRQELTELRSAEAQIGAENESVPAAAPPLPRSTPPAPFSPI